MFTALKVDSCCCHSMAFCKYPYLVFFRKKCLPTPEKDNKIYNSCPPYFSKDPIRTKTKRKFQRLWDYIFYLTKLMTKDRHWSWEANHIILHTHARTCQSSVCTCRHCRSSLAQTDGEGHVKGHVDVHLPAVSQGRDEGLSCESLYSLWACLLEWAAGEGIGQAVLTDTSVAPA